MNFNECLQNVCKLLRFFDFDINKGPYPIGKALHSGGEREIRTLGRVLAVTRFPVVRLRPAQPSLHKSY